MLAEIKPRVRKSAAKRLKPVEQGSVKETATCVGQEHIGEVAVLPVPQVRTSLKGLLHGTHKTEGGSDVQGHNLKEDNSSEKNSETRSQNETDLLLAESGQSSNKNSFSSYRKLSDTETGLINYLETSFKTAWETNCATNMHESLTEMNDFYNAAMIWVMKFIKFIKTVDDFRHLDMETQIKALKGGFRYFMILLAAYSFDVEGNCFVFQEIDRRVGVDMLMEAFRDHRETTERLVHMFRSLQDELFKDPCTMAIFGLVIIFCPAWDDLPDRTCMSGLQNKYLILLKHYIEAKYSYSKGKELFALVLAKFLELKEIIAVREQVLLQMSMDKLTPIAKELFMELKKDSTKKE